MTNPHHDPYESRPAGGAGQGGFDAAGIRVEQERGRGGRDGSVRSTLRDPKRRLLFIALTALLAVTALGALWYADPRNRTRNELVDANETLLRKQREVEDAHRLLEQKVAELRAAKAQADVQATKYQGALEQAAREEAGDDVATDIPAASATALPPGAAPAGAQPGMQPGVQPGMQTTQRNGNVTQSTAGDVHQPLLGQPIRIGRP